jgi:hypothetical protein
LKEKHGLNPAEIEICLEIATEDFGEGVGLNLEKAENANFSKRETGNCQGAS